MRTLTVLVVALAGCPAEPPPTEPPPVRPEIVVEPTALSFGEHPIDAAPRALDITLNNPGRAPLDVYEIAVDDPDAGFSLGLGWNGGVRIPAGSGRTFVVRFDPSVTGPTSTSVRVDSNATDADDPVVIPVEGVGVTATLDVVDAVAFPSASEPGRESVELRNVGLAPLSMTAFDVTGSPAFGVDLDPDRNGDLPFGLNPADPETGRPFRTIFVTFDPELAEGGDVGTLVITSNDAASPIRSVALTTPEG
jgi:hypothetical protein